MRLPTVTKRPDGTESQKAAAPAASSRRSRPRGTCRKVHFGEPIEPVQRPRPDRLGGHRSQRLQRMERQRRDPYEQSRSAARQALRQPPHGSRIRGLQDHSGNQPPQGWKQRRLHPGHLRSAGGRHLRPRDRSAQHGGGLQPHRAGESAEKPAGQWQTMEITFVDRHVTVVLNGKKIIDNQPIRG